MPGQADTTAGPGGGEPSEEELRAAYEAELSRLTTTDMIAQTAVSLLNLGARRLAPPSEDPTHPPERDLEQARDAIDAVRALLTYSSAGSRRSCDHCARRSRACRWPTRGNSVPRPPSHQAPSAPTPERPASRARAARRVPPAASPRRRPMSSRPVPGRRSPAAGCGCPGGERDRRFAPDRRTSAGTRAGRHDRLRPRLHRIDARTERSGRQTCARHILARHANQTAEDFC